MRIAQTLALLTGVSLGLASPAMAGGEGWIQDFEAAKAQAASEGKDLLVDFTGSDWCGWCIKLDKEVFQMDAFKAKVHDDYVLVMLDFPRDKSLVTDEVRAQNEALQQQFGVQGFPSIFLTDSQGRPYAQTGYQEGGPESYLEHLAELQAKKAARDEGLAAALVATGAEKARLLDEALADYSDGVVFGCYGAEVDCIIEADAENEAGLKKKYIGKRVGIEIEGTANRFASASQWAELVTAMDAAATKYEGTDTAVQTALYFKGLGLVRQEMLKEAIATLEVAEDLDDGEPQLASNISRIIRQLEQALEAQEAEEHGEGDGHEHGEGGEGGGGGEHGGGR